MRKHFLILMLLTLLPLAGFADALTDIEVKVYGGVKHYTYGANYTLPTAVTRDMLVFIPSNLDEEVQNEVAARLNFVYSGTPLETNSNVGNYGFTLSLISDGHREFDYPAETPTHHYVITVQDPAGSFAVDKADGLGAKTAPTLKTEDMFYNGQQQDLLKTKGAAYTGFVLEYSVDGGETWSTEGAFITNANPTPGYTVKYRSQATDNYKASDAVDLGPKTVAKGTPTFLTPATKAEDWVYDGKNNQLLTVAATTDFGTVKYNYQFKPAGSDAYGSWSGFRESITSDGLKVRKAGTYKIQTQVPADGNCNKSTSPMLYVTVSQKTLTIKTDDATKVYSDDDPEFTVTYTGLVEGEEDVDALVTAGEFTKPVLERVDGQNVVGGPYLISVKAGGEATAANYAIEYDTENNGSLTITPKELVGNDDSKFTFALKDNNGNDFANPQYTGSEFNPVVEAVFTEPATDQNMVSPTDFTYISTNNVNAGTATVIITGQNNFKGSVTRTFTITKKPIWVKPNDSSKLYGATEPATTALTTYTLVNAAVNGEVVPGAELSGTFTYEREPGNNVGTYKISVIGYEPADPDDDNYEPTALDSYTSWFTIKPVTTTLKLKFSTAAATQAKNTKVYGNADPVFTIDDLDLADGDNGAINNDDWATIKPTLSDPTFTIKGDNVNTENNQVAVTGLYSANYPVIEVEPLPFTVTPRDLIITVKPQTKDFGQAITSTVDDWDVADGWNGISGDTKDDLNVTLSTINDINTYAPDADHENAIKAEIVNDNYNLLAPNALAPATGSVWGTLTVNATAILALDDSKADNYNKILGFDGQKHVTVTVKLDDRDQTFGPYNTQWVAKKYQALVLPFAVTPREISSQLGYAAVSVVDPSKATAQGIYFVLTWDEIPANTPFVVRTDEAIPAEGKTLTFTNKTIEASETAYPSIDASTAASGLGYKFTGAYETYTIDNTSAGKLRVLGSDGTHHGIGASSENHVDVIPFNAFMNLGSSVAPAHVSFFFEDIDGNTTAIRAIEAADAKQNAEGWYTINGVKLLSAPAQKGIYIHNGKKIVVK